MTSSQSLDTLYSDIADLTLGYCKTRCIRMGSCCSAEYCALSIEYAKTEFGVDLKSTGNSLPLLDNTGKCTAPPHLRPMCSVHQCDIAGVGFFKDDPGQTLTQKYFKLRSSIDRIECERFLGRRT